MKYIEQLENENDSLEYELETIKDQIQLMYRYISKLEKSHLELQCMLSKYHDDNCYVCDKAYTAEENTNYMKSIFYSFCSGSTNENNWVDKI